MSANRRTALLLIAAFVLGALYLLAGAMTSGNMMRYDCPTTEDCSPF